MAQRRVMFKVVHETPPTGTPSPNDVASGWTQVLPTANTQVAYVSSTNGNDGTAQVYTANTFTNPWVPPNTILPFQTIAAALAVMPSGDRWILLQKGDTFSITNLGSRSGVDVSAPFIYGYYWWDGAGSNRPILRVASPGHGINLVNTPHDLQIHGIDFHAFQFDPTDPEFMPTPPSTFAGIRMVGPVTRILVEDCLIRWFSGDNIIVEGNTGNHASNITIRRCVVVDNYGTPPSTGIFAIDTDNLLIEDCVFDHNGWCEFQPPPQQSSPSILSRNFYISSNTVNFIIRNTIGSNSSSDAIQMRNGGIADDNLFFRFSVGILASDNRFELTNNVLLHGEDVGGIVAQTAAFNLQEYTGALQSIVRGNVIAHSLGSMEQNRRGFSMNQSAPGIHNCLIEDNVMYAWPYQIRINGVEGDYTLNIFRTNYFQETVDTGRLIEVQDSGALTGFTFDGNTYYRPGAATWWLVDSINMGLIQWQAISGEANAVAFQTQFVDPTRDVASYMASIGQTATEEAFIAEARLQSRHNWRRQYYAPIVNAWIRAGYVPQ